MNTEHGGLIIRGVHHCFGPIIAADDVHLEVRPGEVHGLLGPSGSGKSTLLRLVAGLEKLRRGTISIAGQVVADGETHVLPEARAVGFVFQDYALFPHLDARRNVAFGMSRGSRREKLKAADAWLEKVDLLSHAKAMPHTLSGGQQQRVALARALAREPVVMLLDEPFSGLDQQLRAEVRRTTLDLLRETGVATLMITHDPREALEAGDVVSVIRHGRILQSGSPDAVFRRSSSRQVAEIFGPINILDAVAAQGRVPSPWGDLEAMTEDRRQLEGDVEIYIRPDALALSKADGERRPGLARGKILDVRSDGALAAVRVDVDGRSITVHDLHRAGWMVGEVVGIELDAGAAHVVAAS